MIVKGRILLSYFDIFWYSNWLARIRNQTFPYFHFFFIYLNATHHTLLFVIKIHSVYNNYTLNINNLWCTCTFMCCCAPFILQVLKLTICLRFYYIFYSVNVIYFPIIFTTNISRTQNLPIWKIKTGFWTEYGKKNNITLTLPYITKIELKMTENYQFGKSKC